MEEWMMDYSNLSDLEINKRVFKVVMNGRSWDRQGKSSFDYCNNPADAWPIIKENMISICAYKRANPGMKPVSWWEADYFGENITRNDNPLRAAMIVFLMMQESANVQDNPA